VYGYRHQERNEQRTDSMDVATLADLLHETAQYHDHFEKIAPPYDWWDW